MAKMTIIELTTIVSNILDIPNCILSKRRTRDITRGRFISANLYKRLNPRISVTSLAEAFNKDHCNISFWNDRHDYEMETDPNYVIDYTACCNALGLSINDDDRTDTALVISELNAKIHKLTAENYKLKSSVSMIIRCTDEVSNVINNI